MFPENVMNKFLRKIMEVYWYWKYFGKVHLGNDNTL